MIKEIFIGEEPTEVLSKKMHDLLMFEVYRATHARLTRTFQGQRYEIEVNWFRAWQGLPAVLVLRCRDGATWTHPGGLGEEEAFEPEGVFEPLDPETCSWLIEILQRFDPEGVQSEDDLLLRQWRALKAWAEIQGAETQEVQLHLQL